MRTWIVLAALAACTDHANPTGGDDDAPGDPAPAGTPTGDPTTMTIGPGGGTLTAGELSIVVPAGAVASDTTFSIQPITNTTFAPSGDGYRIAPSGVTFAQPVTLRFAFTADELALGSPEALTIAAQDDAGLWWGHRDAAIDGSAISLAVTSFDAGGAVSARVAPDEAPHADWTKTFVVRVTPASATVRLGKQQQFEARACFKLDANGQLALEEVVMNNCVATPSGATIEWSVNDNTAGGAAGTVAGNGAQATYTAPAKPFPRVFVSAHVRYQNRGLGAAADVTLVCSSGLLLGAGTCAPETWTGTSHVVHTDGAIYDNTFTFAVDTTAQNTQFIVQSGQVNITKQPPSSGDCTVTIEASHPIGPQDGHMTIDETDFTNPTIVGGQGATVWLAVYTLVCPSGTQTTMMPYSIDWWPLPTGGPAPVVAINAMATITAANPGETGTIIIARDSP